MIHLHLCFIGFVLKKYLNQFIFEILNIRLFSANSEYSNYASNDPLNWLRYRNIVTWNFSCASWSPILNGFFDCAELYEYIARSSQIVYVKLYVKKKNLASVSFSRHSHLLQGLFLPLSNMPSCQWLSRFPAPHSCY